MTHEAFYVREDGDFVATPMTRGPWDDNFQHGGPPAALLTGAMERFEGGDDYRIVRVTIELLKPVPIAPLRIERVAPLQAGRTVQRLEATLSAGGETVMLARGLRIKRAPITVPPAPSAEPWPDPEALGEFVFPFFHTDVGYHRAVELKIAHGNWGSTPVGFWARPRIPLVAGQETSALEDLMILADAQSGMGVPLDPTRFTFLNPDLTVYLERAPEHGWLGFDIRSTANSEGAGLAQSAVRDTHGLVARSAQSLVVMPRQESDRGT